MYVRIEYPYVYLSVYPLVLYTFYFVYVFKSVYKFCIRFCIQKFKREDIVYFSMGFFSRDKEDKEKLTPREMHEMIEQLKEEGRQKLLREKLQNEKPISDSSEYADFNEIMSKMRHSLKPVQDELKKDLGAVEKPIAREVVRVETALKKDLSMIRVPKELKAKLKELRQGKENYAETIERLINHA